MCEVERVRERAGDGVCAVGWWWVGECSVEDGVCVDVIGSIDNRPLRSAPALCCTSVLYIRSSFRRPSTTRCVSRHVAASARLQLVLPDTPIFPLSLMTLPRTLTLE